MTAKNKKNNQVNDSMKKQKTKLSVKEESKNLIMAYSDLEQKRNGVKTPMDALAAALGIFPFVILLTNLYSCFGSRLSNRTYRQIMVLAGSILLLIVALSIVVWVNRIFYVYMIDENHQLYRLRISNFWYKLRNQTGLIRPYGMPGGRLMRLFYMVSNIKKVLENISDTITYEELIAMGRLEKISDIRNLETKKKSYSFLAKLVNKDHPEGLETRIKICRVYENDHQLENFLREGKPGEKEKISDIILEIKREKTPLAKLAHFTIVWTCIMAWIAAFLLGGDLARLARINAGEYVKTTVETEKGSREVFVSTSDEDQYFDADDYGKLYRPIIVLYGVVEIIYLISGVADMTIEAVKKNPEKS